ncbi:phospholipid carrier-dependent glycosyltransferase [Patescibacteria group bacterium]|nr:phospholipid carrier-dependent glycosyltransferase [Patescibacteria group bacterium]
MKKHWLLVLALLILATYLRLYRIDAPLADWHSFRQADTASVTREFIKHNYSILEPHYHDHSNIQSGQDNPQGYRMVEFPIVNFFIAQIIKLNPQLDLVITSRLVSIGFSLIGLISLYGFVFLLSKRQVLALLSGFMFAVLPFSVFYSRVILPEPAMLGTQLLSMWLFLAWLQQTNKNKTSSRLLYAGSLIAFSLSLLLKPTAIFIVPVFIILSLVYFGKKAFISPWLIAYATLAITPLIGWREWIKQFPQGIPVSTWLLNGNGIRLRPAWWRWIFAERIAKLILGYWGVSFLFLGLIGRIRTSYRRSTLFDVITLVWAGSMFLYLVAFATGNVQHDYYQALLIPIISILTARGILWITEGSYIRKLVAWPSLLIVLALSLFMSWWEIRGYYEIQHPEIVRAGQKVDQITPLDARIIAPYQGDTAFLFQTNRTGWPIGFEIADKIAKGADYYVSVNYDDETNRLMNDYRVIFQTDEYVIIKLQ